MKTYIQQNNERLEVIITSEKRPLETLRDCKDNEQPLKVSGVIKGTNERFNELLKDIIFVTSD